MSALQAAIDRFSANPQDELLQEHMNQMRSKFKTIVTLLGLQQEHLATGHADIDSAAPDTSF